MRSVGVHVPPDVLLSGPFRVPLGGTAWLPVDVRIRGGLEVAVIVEVACDDLVAPVTKRIVRMPVTVAAVRICVELFGLHLTGAECRITIRAEHDAGFSQTAEIPVIVVVDD